MLEQGNKYDIPHLTVSLEAIFPKWFEQTKKFWFFGKGTARWMFFIHLSRNHLLWAFAAVILWKTQPRDIFARVSRAKCTASCNDDGCLEDNYCVPFFKLKFLIPTLRPIFCLSKASKIYREVGKIYIFVVWKKILIYNGKKI